MRKDGLGIVVLVLAFSFLTLTTSVVTVFGSVSSEDIYFERSREGDVERIQSPWLKEIPDLPEDLEYLEDTLAALAGLRNLFLQHRFGAYVEYGTGKVEISMPVRVTVSYDDNEVYRGNTFPVHVKMEGIDGKDSEWVMGLGLAVGAIQQSRHKPKSWTNWWDWSDWTTVMDLGFDCLIDIDETREITLGSEVQVFSDTTSGPPTSAEDFVVSFSATGMFKIKDRVVHANFTIKAYDADRQNISQFVSVVPEQSQTWNYQGQTETVYLHISDAAPADIDRICLILDGLSYEFGCVAQLTVDAVVFPGTLNIKIPSVITQITELLDPYVEQVPWPTTKLEAASLVIADMCVKNRAPDTPSTPSGPSGCYRGVPCGSFTSATDPDGDQVQYQFKWGDGSQSDWTSLVNSGALGSLSHAYTETGTYVIKARAKDELGETSAWSSGHEVTVTINQAPAPPTISTMYSSGHTGMGYTFYASATDTEGERVSYQFDWGDGSQSNWASFVSSGTRVRFSHAYTEPGSYDIKARAKDEGERESPWSLPHTITITIPNRPPTTPVVSGPSTGSKGVSLTFTAEGADPDGDAWGYRFDWGDGHWSEFSQPRTNNTSESQSHTYTTAYTRYVRAQARDEHGATSPWSVPFEVEVVGLPPIADAGPDRTVMLGAGIRLDGSASSDPDDFIVRYEWYRLPIEPERWVSEYPTVLFPSEAQYETFGKNPVSYELLVEDVDDLTDTDEVTITLAAPNLESTDKDIALSWPEGPNPERKRYPNVGDPVTITVHVDNIGNADCRSFQVGFYDWNISLTTKTISQLGAGQGTTVRATWIAEGGEHTICTWADFGTPSNMTGRIIEWDEDNNEGCSKIYVNFPPVAVLGANPTSGNAPLNVTFDASGSYDPEQGLLTYDWDFDDGATSTLPTTSHAYNAAGIYEVTLTVTDDNGATSTDTATITVKGLNPSYSLVKFKGTATTKETRNEQGMLPCYGSYYIKVRIDEILGDPDQKLIVGNEYTVCYGDSPKTISAGDRVEVYGIYYHSGGPMQCVGNIVAIEKPYYVKMLGAGGGLAVDLWVDKGCGSTYAIGERITISFEVNRSASVTIYDYTTDGRTEILFSEDVNAGTHTAVSGRVSGSSGTEKLEIVAQADGETSRDTCTFYIGSSGPGDSTTVTLTVKAMARVLIGPITMNIGINVPIQLNGVSQTTPFSKSVGKGSPVALVAPIQAITLFGPVYFDGWVRNDERFSDNMQIGVTLYEDATFTAQYVPRY